MSEEGTRLAKRVAAERGCSRREAEQWIAAGAVQVAGETVTDPARRVPDHVPLQIGEAVTTGAITVLLYKPAGVTAASALSEAWAALALGPVPLAGLRELLPLPVQASGLSVWSDERPTVRRLLDRERPLETEWLLALPMAAVDPIIAPLRAGGVRASLSHERDGTGQWRLVDKGDRGQALADFLDGSQFAQAWSLRRQRIGRMGLSPLAPGQARLRLDFEKF
ncbi:MAG: S4 domain-containing protein [Limnohabitans sp.]